MIHGRVASKLPAASIGFLLMGDLVEVGPTDVVFADAEQEETREYVAGVFG